MSQHLILRVTKQLKFKGYILRLFIYYKILIENLVKIEIPISQEGA